MCGICGMFKFNGEEVDIASLKRMNDRMVHRGPDDEGYSCKGNAGIAMRRLSIIDLEGGRQPIANEDFTLEVVANGEIYNYLELRDELIAKGHVFRTHSDTEVLLHLYEEYGAGCLDKLNGMFAFIIWDKSRDKLWIARDRLGIKPLYFFKDDNLFVCASDLNALAAALDKNPVISKQAFLNYLVMAYTPVNRSIYNGVEKLSPGCCMEVGSRGVHIRRYWNIEDVKCRRITYGRARDRLMSLLCDSVRLQKRSDVAVGTFLSGGLDSSSVVALLSKETTDRVRTLTADFQGKDINESPYARIVADAFCTRHSRYSLDARAACGMIKEMMPFIDEPICDSALIPSYFLSKTAQKLGLKVLLNGTGGDEIFGGYARHHPYPLGSKYWLAERVPVLFKRAAASFFSVFDYHYSACLSSEACYFGISISGVDLSLLRTLLRKRADFDCCMDILKESFGSLFDAKNKQNCYPKMRNDLQNYLAGDVLSLLDKTTMAASIEGRVPLLDHRLVEFAYSLPEDINIYKRQPKGLFKAAMQGIVPHEILNRRKAGFNAPVASWMEGLRAQMTEAFGEPNLLFREMFDTGRLFGFVNGKERRFSPKTSETLFSLYVFDLWHKHNYH